MTRTEVSRTYSLDSGRMLTVILRDTIVPEDPYINMCRAKCLSVRTGEPYDSDRTSRVIKDQLIKTNVTL
jgi:hypothetical protein